MNHTEILALLAAGLNAYESRLHRQIIEELAREFLARPDPRPGAGGVGDAVDLPQRLYSFLKGHIELQIEAVLALRKRFADYTRAYAAAMTFQEKQRQILDLARDLGAGGRQLRGDRGAFSRWFGHDAIIERHERRLGSIERRISICLERLGVLAERILSSGTSGPELRSLWTRLGLEATLTTVFTWDGDSRVSVAAFRALSRALHALPAEIRERSVDEKTLRFIYRSAIHPPLDVWLQCEAIGLLDSLSAGSLQKVLEQRLTKPAPGDDIFVRKRAVKLLLKNLGRLPALVDLLPAAAQDPSPFVRQGFVDALPMAPTACCITWLEELAVRDPVPQVRAAACIASIRLLDRAELRETVLQALEEVLRDDRDTFVLRVALHAACRCAERLAAAEDAFLERWKEAILPAIEKLHVEAESIPVRRWAAQARDVLWSEYDLQARALKKEFAGKLAGIRRSGSRDLSLQDFPWSGDDHAGRVLSVLAQEDFGWDVEVRGRKQGRRVARVTRGHRFGFRWWRFLYEFRNPSPDKRQAFRHTIGRIFRGDARAPSTILCELAETRVPGEPLFISEEGGWRPYLPLLDEALSSLSRDRRAGPVRIFTSEGITELAPPDSPRDRMRAFSAITLRYAALSKLRNWRSQLQEPPASYISELEALGFSIRIQPYRMGGASGMETASMDPAVLRFFPALLILPGIEIWDRFKEYFVSVYDNSLFELSLFTGLAGAAFLGRHILANVNVRRRRRRIPLVVGGWGTRGKSGTERLKAALFNALGHGVVSKTTGCEAMFLFAHPFGKTREMFLFRSYDKATIWEQKNVLDLAERLGADVFLWECMALTPAYVEVLQHSWVRDDLSTITNTYPDHEDIQGPAGIDIPDVIGIFIPPHSRAATTEEQMLPILMERAKERGTVLRRVSWIEQGIIAPDVLKRFPYDEHPSNVALVLDVAEEMGIDRDYAIKEIADRVVPDLGVLKTSPVARVRGRRVQFVNGCSANERHGTLSNWTRCGFQLQDPVAEPGVWITTVVNNRADRVPRSRVFARILVEDIQADRHFLIGGNLNGLVGYIHQAWESYAETLSLWPEGAQPDPAGVLRRMFLAFRMPVEEDHVAARLRAMLSEGEMPPGADRHFLASLHDPDALREKLTGGGFGKHAEAIVRQHRLNLDALREYQGLRAEVERAGENRRAVLDGEFQDLLWRWLQRKLVVVEDYYISGEKLVDLIVGETPPGYFNRIMGIQNIKGTGLDFVYRWQAWDACYRACTQLAGGDAQTMEKGLRALSAFQEYGVLSEELVDQTLRGIKNSPAAQSEQFQAELALVESNYRLAMAQLKEKLQEVRRKAGWFERLVGAVEGFLDSGDAIKRRKTANRIYRDLIAMRISTDRAILELQQLNKRQKGGWLIKKVLSAQSFLAKALGAILLRSTKGRLL